MQQSLKYYICINLVIIYLNIFMNLLMITNNKLYNINHKKYNLNNKMNNKMTIKMIIYKINNNIMTIKKNKKIEYSLKIAKDIS